MAESSKTANYQELVQFLSNLDVNYLQSLINGQRSQGQLSTTLFIQKAQGEMTDKDVVKDRNYLQGVRKGQGSTESQIQGLGGQGQQPTEEEKAETLRIVQEMSDILNCGLDPSVLPICIQLIEDGVQPLALAKLIKTWKESKTAIPTGSSTTTSSDRSYDNAFKPKRNGKHDL